MIKHHSILSLSVIFTCISEQTKGVNQSLTNRASKSPVPSQSEQETNVLHFENSKVSKHNATLLCICFNKEC